MSKKSPNTVKRATRRLRQEVIDGDDLLAARVAYGIECAVRWATEDTVGWPSLVDTARSTAAMIRREADFEPVGLHLGEARADLYRLKERESLLMELVDASVAHEQVYASYCNGVARKEKWKTSAQRVADLRSRLGLEGGVEHTESGRVVNLDSSLDVCSACGAEWSDEDMEEFDYVDPSGGKYDHVNGYWVHAKCPVSPGAELRQASVEEVSNG